MGHGLRAPAALAVAGLLCVASIAYAECGRGNRSGGRGAEARIYAAASLTDAIRELAASFESDRRSRVVASFGASNTLAHQIRDGAEPGVFISANVEWVETLDSWGLVEPGTRVDLLGNSLVVVVPKGSKHRPGNLRDLSGESYARIALADPVAVPAGTYAKAALEKAGVLDLVGRKVVAAEDVRTALVYVERGEAMAGIVYATDAAVSDKVDVAFHVPPELYPKVICPMVLVKGSNTRARELYEFLQTAEARDAFEKAGFTTP